MAGDGHGVHLPHGGGGGHHAADGLWPLHGAVASAHGRHPAAERHRVAGDLRALSDVSAVSAGQQLDDAERLQSDLPVGIRAPSPGATHWPGVLSPAGVLRRQTQAAWAAVAPLRSGVFGRRRARAAWVVHGEERPRGRARGQPPAPRRPPLLGAGGALLDLVDGARSDSAAREREPAATMGGPNGVGAGGAGRAADRLRRADRP